MVPRPGGRSIFVPATNMVRIGNLVMLNDPKDRLLELDPADLELLLRTADGDLPGMIMRLNHEPRYHNRLNAIGLADELKSLRAELERPNEDPGNP